MTDQATTETTPPQHVTTYQMRPGSNITEDVSCSCGWTKAVTAGYGNAAARKHQLDEQITPPGLPAGAGLGEPYPVCSCGAMPDPHWHAVAEIDLPLAAGGRVSNSSDHL